MPETDDSPPDVQVQVTYRTKTGADRQLDVTGADTSRTIPADANHAVVIRYAASDSSGLRRLIPGLTIQQTVGVGVERRHVPIDPVVGSCPRAALSAEHEVYGTGERRVLIITAGAENWLGERAAIEPLTLRME